MNEYTNDESISTLKTTMIAKGAKIVGNIDIEGDVIVEGTVNGNITCNHKVTINGVVDGDIQSGTLECNDSVLNGNVKCEESISLGESATISGNCEAANVKCAGRIKGNVYVNSSIELSEKAAIVGDISAMDIEIKRGAVVQGKLEIRQDVYFEGQE